MNDRIDLKTKIAFLERAIEELSAVVHEESRARQLLQQRLDRLENSQASGGPEVGPQDDPPPHY